jgi:hypothetical protein
MTVLQPGRRGSCRVSSVWRWCINCGLGGCGGASSPRPPFVPLTHSCRTFYKAPTNPAHSTPTFQILLQSQSRDLHTGKRRSHYTRNSRFRTARQFRSLATLSNPASDCKAPGDNMSESKWTGVKVRQTFHEYFAERGHTVGT